MLNTKTKNYSDLFDFAEDLMENEDAFAEVEKNEGGG